MLSTLLACLLLWVFYLWSDRRRLLRIMDSSSTRKSPTKPRFINSQPNPGAQPTRSTSSRSKPIPPSTPRSEINFNALQKEVARRRKEGYKVSATTQNELYRLVRGDRGTVERLIKYGRARYPDRSEQWVWEKVIRDLERDRGYR